MAAKRFLAIVAILALAVAMGGSSRMQGSPTDFDPTTYKNPNELLKEVSDEVPEFGGAFLSDNQTVLNIYLTGDATEAAKQQKARQEVEKRFDLKPGLTLNVIKGDYSITQLADWYALMESRGIWDQEGVFMTDLDEGANELYIGVVNAANIEPVYKFLVSIGIPRAAVTVAVEEQPVPASHTLQDRAHDDKMAGGYQISFGGLGNCTLGFVAIKSGTAGMVTAGHCTEAQPYDGGVTSSNRVHQPSSYNVIGYEDIDPAFSTSLSRCTDSDGCRHSDAAFVDFSSGVQYNRGWIAKPSSDWGTSVDPDTAHYSITRDYGIAMVGDEVLKVGRSTGRTRGRVTRVCFNSDDMNNTAWIGTYLCQTQVGVSANAGDSGSPVFAVQSGDRVRLVGILTHRTTSTYDYSPLGGVFLDLGRTSTWNVCTSGC